MIPLKVLCNLNPAANRQVRGVSLCFTVPLERIIAFMSLLFHRSYLSQPDVLKPLLNPMYEPNTSILWPSVASQSLVSFRNGRFLDISTKISLTLIPQKSCLIPFVCNGKFKD